MGMFNGTPLERLAVSEAEIDPGIVAFLHVGNRADVYATGQVQHNTLSSNVESILEQGLIPGCAASVPDEEDISFARELMHQSSGYSPEVGRRFDTYVAGEKQERPPGVFLSVFKPGEGRFNSGYGVPERSMILMHEMGAVALAKGTFDTDIRERAADIHKKYRDRLFPVGEHVAVLAVDPFSPQVIAARLSEIDPAIEIPEDILGRVLPTIGGTAFEGLYIPGVIPARDIRVTDLTMPLPEPPRPLDDISRSRFYAPSLR